MDYSAGIKEILEKIDGLELDYDLLLRENARLEVRISSLEAARIAYADVGPIHHNIRELKHRMEGLEK